MKDLKIFHVDAFTSEAFGGNPAGVVPDASIMTSSEMQAIAKELNLSETAFLTPSQPGSNADFQIRFFTPTSEINFCGHATVASAWLLGTVYEWIKKKNMITFETNIGHVPVEFVLNEGKLDSVMMTQVEPKVKSIDTNIDELVSIVGLSREDIASNYPIRIAYTGNWHLLIPVKSRKAIDDAIPQMTKLKEHNEAHQITTTHLFTFDSQEEDCIVYTRDFAPAVGINEDPVTGSANGALTGYFILEGIFDFNKDHSFQIAQGQAMGRPGKVKITIGTSQEKPLVKVGGSAVPTIAGTVIAPL
ncbi:PhzF family phenazine biosynthesis protein [Alkalihalobacillus sp. MEB130]|uniref:PhzF family phenazine biosynthesis protein n=1 Tax=Alkalihalobacillus sp. MEB130 TaxID=2976704 RepID=UPI0028DDCA1C|nr:PhzF family phenazine biosynthesis protein [Alkalihalobacillus sp. MEB130]MDT8861171.1 PhzF family phenazine biosynthesis protein [Alkalihalobacillus sp. MEB130]